MDIRQLNDLIKQKVNHAYKMDRSWGPEGRDYGYMCVSAFLLNEAGDQGAVGHVITILSHMGSGNLASPSLEL